ncbi:hypothetical protein EB001_25715, partial [bacterium]|nr:hypothetical protein [bacterium]
ELAEQAQQYAEYTTPQGLEWLPTFQEKFAELIVRECIAQCEKNAEHIWLGSGSKLSAFNIKEHFGVE